ncbi:MAG: hypothetical protein ACRC33_27330 [Gemmataceae bacterium]
MTGSRKMLLATCLAALAATTAAQAGPFRDGPNSRSFFGRPFRPFGGWLTRSQPEAPPTTYAAPAAVTQEPPLADAAPATPASVAPLPAGPTAPSSALPAGPAVPPAR